MAWPADHNQPELGSIQNVQMRMPWLMLLAMVVYGVETRVPASVRQGDTIHIEVRDLNVTSAKFEGKRVPVFVQEDGTRLGLMPVKLDQMPGSYRLELLEKDERVVHTATIEVVDAKFAIQDIAATRRMRSLKPLPGETDAVAMLRNMVSQKRYWKEPFTLPAPQCQNSPFGVHRYYNGKPSGNYHRGIDLRSRTGTPIRAPADGIVRVSRMFRLHGGTVGIDHGQGVVTMYLHLSRLRVKEGAIVKRRQIIAEAGATGFATGAHLHWAVYVHGVSVNPIQWLAEPPVRCD